MSNRVPLGILFVAGLGCGGSSQIVCKEDPTTGFERCHEPNNYGEAAVVGGTAAAVWGVAGCTVNGCEAPYRCNAKTKRCERVTCHADADCPAGYNCDVGEKKCW